MAGTAQLHPVEEAPQVDVERAESAVAELLTALGRDLDDDHLADTPRRVVEGLLGVAHVGYVPGARIVGLSKLARVVDWHARDLQVQKGLTMQIADHLERRLEARGVGVAVRAEHLCMTVRGIRAEGAATITTAFRGVLADGPALRARFGVD